MERLWTNSFRVSTICHSFPTTPLWDTNKATEAQKSSKQHWQGWPWDHVSWSPHTLFTGSAKLAWEGYTSDQDSRPDMRFAKQESYSKLDTYRYPKWEQRLWTLAWPECSCFSLWISPVKKKTQRCETELVLVKCLLCARNFCYYVFTCEMRMTIKATSPVDEGSKRAMESLSTELALVRPLINIIVFVIIITILTVVLWSRCCQICLIPEELRLREKHLRSPPGH